MADVLVNYDKAVADILKAEFGESIEIFHDKAPEVGDAAYPFLVYKTLSVSPAYFTDDKMICYQHDVRVTIVTKNASVKSIENSILSAMTGKDYAWQGTHPTVEDREYGELYVPMDFIKKYWR